MIYRPTIKAEIKLVLRANRVLTEKELLEAILQLETRLNSSTLVEPVISGSTYVKGNARFHFQDIKTK